jgi:hypothetical protein
MSRDRLNILLKRSTTEVPQNDKVKLQERLNSLIGEKTLITISEKVQASSSDNSHVYTRLRSLINKKTDINVPDVQQSPSVKNILYKMEPIKEDYIFPNFSAQDIAATFEKDMAVMFVYFNPAKSKRILMNYLFVNNFYKINEIPTFTIEIVVEDRQPELCDAIQVRSNSYMFYKEQAYRILEKSVPEQFQKLAFLDADVMFDTIDWYRRASEKLNTTEVVQPFETAIWLDITYSKELLKRSSWIKMPPGKVKWEYHSGFAWCMQRSYYRDVGFFDKGFANGGDAQSAVFWTDRTVHYRMCRSQQNSYNSFCCKKKPSIEYLPAITLYHLFHGQRQKRQYYDVRSFLDINNDIDDITFTNEYGLSEWKDCDLNEKMYKYFQEREDDSI